MISLTKPTVGSVGWGDDVNQNFTDRVADRARARRRGGQNLLERVGGRDEAERRQPSQSSPNTRSSHAARSTSSRRHSSWPMA